MDKCGRCGASGWQTESHDTDDCIDYLKDQLFTTQVRISELEERVIDLQQDVRIVLQEISRHQ